MILGIDLGTTNSVAAVWRDGDVSLIPNRLGSFLTPSAVSIDGSSIIVGMAARDRQVTHPADTATAFKRYMGTRRVTKLGRQAFSPEELSALVLRSLKEDAEAFLGEVIGEAVITVPAYFNDKQRRATRRAGELAGLKVERLINEPTAASLAYGLHKLDDEARFLVFDLGGGTFDVSIVEIFEGIMEVRASTGDNSLGGEDFNEALIALGCEKTGQSPPRSGALYQRLRHAAEQTKRALGSSDNASFDYVWEERSFAAEIGQEEFEAAAAPLLARLRDPVVQAIRDSNVRPETLSDVVLIGGSTRMPLVRRLVTRMFSRFPNTSVDPDLAVAMGAAVQAGLKERNAALGEVVLTDVCPFSLGVDTTNRLPSGQLEEGLFSPIIERNTVIPASRIRTYGTLVDNQKLIRFNVYQGEDRRVENNVKIGSIDIPMPPSKAGLAAECRFTYDINGLLEVDLHVPASGESRQLVITDEDETDDDLDARRARLAELKVHPRDTEVVRALIARAERCWQASLAEKREHIGHSLNEFNAVLETQNPRKVETACVGFAEFLDQIEGVPYL